jgi:hypothetical protein
MKYKKKNYLLNWIHLYRNNYQVKKDILILIFITSTVITLLISSSYKDINFNNIYATTNIENNVKYIKLFDSNTYISMGKVEKKSETVINNSNANNTNSNIPSNDTKTPFEIPFHSSIPKEELEKLKETIKNKPAENQTSANIIKLNKSLLTSNDN